MSVTTQILETDDTSGISSEDLWDVTADWRTAAEAIVDDVLMRVAALELDKLQAAKAAHPSSWR